MLITTDTAAAQLACTPIEVLRLIATGALRATRVGTDGPLRILQEDLNAFIAGGAVGFDTPGDISRRNWYSAGLGKKGDRYVRDEHQAAALAGKVRDLLDTAVAKLAEPAANVTAVTVNPTGEMRALASGPLPVMFSPDKTTVHESWIGAHVDYALRAAAKSFAKDLTRFFADKPTFEKLAAQAIATVAGSTISVRRTFPGVGNFAEAHTVTYSARVLDLIPGGTNALMKLASKAF